jgi:hypothetical protein
LYTIEYKCSYDGGELEPQRDSGYYSHIYLAIDYNKNDVLVPLSDATEVCGDICISFTNLLQVVSMLIIGDKVSLFEHTISKKAFGDVIAAAWKDGTVLDRVMDTSVSSSEHQSNINQTKPLHGLQVPHISHYKCLSYSSNQFQHFHYRIALKEDM